MSRILGIDYGERRIGLAISDPTGTIARPLPTLTRRRGKRPPVEAVARLIREEGVDEVVIGLPLTPEGVESDWTRETRAYGENVGERAGVPVNFVDERCTSARAERAVRELGLKKKDREDKARVDAAAAVLILQAFLDRRKNA